MTPCDKYRADILRYLDNELSGRRLERFLAHLKTCAYCKAQLEQEQALSDILRRSRPLYSASSDLRNRVSSTLTQHLEANSPSGHMHRPLKELVGQFFPQIAHFVPRWTILVAAALVIAACLIIVPNSVREVRAASYITAAISAHNGYLTGSLPLEVRSSSPELVTAWLSDRLTFPFRLPDSRSGTGGSPSYRLVGARLVNYKGEHAALLAYEEAHNDAISLLVADSRSAMVAGGDEVRSGELIFHYRNESGLRVITWSTHGLSYALVSNVSGLPQASCLVCHQNMTDHDHFKR